MPFGLLLFLFLFQILSNEEKRTNYDHYGDAGENQGYQQQREYRFRHFHENFYFDESFFHFPFNSERRDSIDEKYLLHFSHYVNEVVPDSFKKPYLIKITSDWCFSCIHIEPVWKEVVQELEGLGKSFPLEHVYTEDDPFFSLKCTCSMCECSLKYTYVRALHTSGAHGDRREQ